jgi:peroxiredoxin family protein
MPFCFAEQEERKCRAASGSEVSVFFSFFPLYIFFQTLARIHLV